MPKPSTARAGAARHGIASRLLRLLRLLRQGVRRLGGADELDELRAVAEGIVTARRLGDLQHVVIAEGAGLAAAAQDLAEARDGGREAGVLRRGLEADLLGAAVDR